MTPSEILAEVDKRHPDDSGFIYEDAERLMMLRGYVMGLEDKPKVSREELKEYLRGDGIRHPEEKVSREDVGSPSDQAGAAREVIVLRECKQGSMVVWVEGESNPIVFYDPKGGIPHFTGRTGTLTIKNQESVK